MLTKTEKLMILLVAIGAMCIYLSWNRTRIQREEIMVEEVWDDDDACRLYLDSVWVEENRRYDSLLRNPESELYRSDYNDIGNVAVVTVTKYNPVRSQCDDTPLVTASGNLIDLGKLKKGSLRWIAVSRDLREKFKYGTIVELIGSPEIEGEWVVTDTMNPRWTKRVDLLCPPGDTLGKWDRIIIKKKKRGN